jgi:membrane-bound inhibitor of C-type lysozyme
MIRLAVAASRCLSFAAVLLGLAAAVGCMSEKAPAGEAASTSAEAAAQPRHATYRCGDEGTLEVDNMRTSVRLTDLDGETVELPAAPSDQTSRYGQTPYALLLEGNEALYMKAGREPVTCLR